jgi:hypothetical protein
MQTSFIPKKSYNNTKTKRKDYGGLSMGISVTVFILMVLTAATVFLYKRYLNTQVNEMAVALDREKGSLEKDIIKELSLVSKKIESAKKILDKHVILTPLFELLEQNTLGNVAFEKLSIAQKKDGWFLEMSGEANSFTTVALQSDAFGNNKNMSDVVFSGLGAGLEGGVVFDVSILVNERFFSYRNSLE